MDALLTLLSILGLGALVISVYIFAMAARRFVSDETGEEEYVGAREERRRGDRRQNTAPVIFPITVDGELISEDRRRGDRRRDAA